MTRTLAEWLSYQEKTHKQDIELGLGRIRAVWQRMGAPRPAACVVTVAGTNGKGSTVALIEGMYRAAGYRVGCYTSPHVARYNERIRTDGKDEEDAALVASFERIEAARGEIPLTYFEFGTLAAIDVLGRASLDVAILEVGIGGRLDAVNIIDADLAVITTIDLDHQEWLGGDRDSIGREKAGIARSGRPVIVGDRHAPAGLLDALREQGALLVQAGEHFHREPLDVDGAWRWTHCDGTALQLPRVALDAPVQADNAATAVAVVHALGSRFPVRLEAISDALRRVSVPGRLQRVAECPATFVDVGHNPQAARALAEWLDRLPVHGRVRAVFGALADKDVDGVMASLGARVDTWYLAGLDRDTPRGLRVEALASRLARVLPDADHQSHVSVADAWSAARADADAADIVLLFGSFFVASAAIGSSK